MSDAPSMKKDQRPKTLEELWALEEKHPFSAGNPLSLGAAHFRTPPKWRVPKKSGNGAHRRKTSATK